MSWVTKLGTPTALVKVALLRGAINASLVLPGKQRGIGEQNLKVDTSIHLAKPQSFYARLESFKMVAAEPLISSTSLLMTLALISLLPRETFTAVLDLFKNITPQAERCQDSIYNILTVRCLET